MKNTQINYELRELRMEKNNKKKAGCFISVAFVLLLWCCIQTIQGTKKHFETYPEDEIRASQIERNQNK